MNNDQVSVLNTNKLKKKNQLPDKTTILIPCFNTESLDFILYYALPVAKQFNASLSFLFMGDEYGFESFKKELHKFFPNFLKNNECSLYHFSTQYKYAPVMEKNQQDEEAIMVIFPRMPSGNFLFFRQLAFMLKVKKLCLPYMILQPPVNYDIKWAPQNIIMPIGYRRTDKDTAVWASYFKRFGNSNITILYAKENDIISQKEIKNNLKFIKNMYNKLNISANIVSAKTNSGKLQFEAVNLAQEMKNSLVIITSTKYYGIEHYFLGPMELQTIKNPQKIPILCINSRKDLYVLCK